MTGAKPVFVDIGPDFNIDPEKIEAAITASTKAIVPMHVAGLMCDMDKICEIARRKKLLVLEDAAQAYCSTLGSKRAGSFSIAAAFSMNPMKILHGYGEAGAIVTNSRKVYQKILQLRHAGTFTKFGSHDINRCNFISLNHKIDTIQASFLLEEMDRIHEIKKKRDEIAEYYDRQVPSVGCQTQPFSAKKIHGRYYYLITCKKRNRLKKFLESCGIESKVFYSPLTCDSLAHKFSPLPKLPIARKNLSKCLSIPMHENMTMPQARYVVKSIRDFYK